MRRRDFLKETSAALAAAALGSCSAKADWRRLRLVYDADAGEIERTALADAASLLERAIGVPVPIVSELAPSGDLDVLVSTEGSASKPGGFRISREGSRLVVSGFDPEGARNGLYRLLEHLGFAFFRDGETIPALVGPAHLDLDASEEPSFALRGDMIWDNYLGPRRFCAAMWGDDDWERALLYLARNRMNFLEFYPPLEHSMSLAFPEARRLSQGAVWKAEVKHQLAKKVLARGRALGIRFMYVLSYGAFPEPVRALFPCLEWRNGFLCAHQPELPELTEKVWRRVVEGFGTDGWYAIRHRGEEEQPYGDPCRSVTKKEGYLQAFAVLSKIDPEASATVWTWGEKVPDLFEGFPENVRAVHVRHGMANVFGDRGEGREQRDGAPSLEGGRRWLSAQFTVFGGNEALLQTGWSDASTLAQDAESARADGRCEGFFQWPEWSDTSPWLSHAIARIAWDPEGLGELEPALSEYARARHGERAERYLAGFLPLLKDGNARFMNPPRKRLLVPYFLAPESLKLLEEARAGARTMMEALKGASKLYERDFVDLLAWVGLRQAQVFEAAAYLAHLDLDRESSADAGRKAEATWNGLRDVLSQSPELSLVSSTRGLSQVGELSTAVIDSLWTLGCDFYNGYPLVLSPEAIELVYLPQLAALRKRIESAAQSSLVCTLDEPGWFWHDFPDRRWADSVRRLPSEDASRLEEEMKSRLRAAVAGETPKDDRAPLLELEETRTGLEHLLAFLLPPERKSPPILPPPAG
jgi:hypothetical protein